MMNTLKTLIEDKKKGCGQEINQNNYINRTILRCSENTEYCPKCKYEITILEQAIAEMQKQRQEILDKIVNYNQNKLRWLWNDGEIFIALSSIKQQLNQPKTEK